MKIGAIAAASVLALVVIVGDCKAAETATLYVGLGVGIQFMGPSPFEGTGSFANSSSTLSFSDGPTVTGSVGYAFGNNFRTEFEFGYRDVPGINSCCTALRDRRPSPRICTSTPSS